MSTESKEAWGDKVYADAKALCYGAAMEAAKPFERTRLEHFTAVEIQMIDRIAEWMGSRDCEIVGLKRTIEGNGQARVELMKQLEAAERRIAAALAKCDAMKGDCEAEYAAEEIEKELRA